MKLLLALFLTLLCATAHVVVAKVTVDETHQFTTITDASFKIEILRMLQDPVYDHSVKSPEGKVADIDAIASYADATPYYAALNTTMNTKQVSANSYNIKVTRLDHNEVFFTYAEGRTNGTFLSGKTLKPIDGALLDQFAATVATVTTLQNERLKAIVPTLPGIAKKAFNEYPKYRGAAARPAASGVSVAGGRAASAAFRQMFLKPSTDPTAASATSSSLLETGVVDTYRYDVFLFQGIAFNLFYGAHHSSSIIMRVDHATNTILQMQYNGNHGRMHDENGMTPKCVHTGARTIAASATQPTTWDCSTMYYPVWCFSPIRAHNCNANAQYQIHVSDNPASPPANNAGICAGNCPARSPSC